MTYVRISLKELNRLHRKLKQLTEDNERLQDRVEEFLAAVPRMKYKIADEVQIITSVFVPENSIIAVCKEEDKNAI
jgi:hypothetical protein